MLPSKWSAFKTLGLTSSTDTMSLNCDPSIKSTFEAWLQTQDALASTCTDRVEAGRSPAKVIFSYKKKKRV